MKQKILVSILSCAFALTLYGSAVGQDIAPAPNGIVLPKEYIDWRVISSSSRTDNDTLRILVGNDATIKAARQGNTNP